MMSASSTETSPVPDKTTRYQQVYNHLRNQILSGAWKKGARIPTEVEIAKQCEVSLITVRQAQRMLVEEGLIIKRQGLGTFVTELAAERLKILWVCGASRDGTDISRYYHDCLRLCREESAARGLGMDVAWLFNHDADAAMSWLEEHALGNYIGFFLIGCYDKHHLLQEIRSAKHNYVQLGGAPGTGNRVTRDPGQALRLGLEQLGEPGEGPVLVLRMDSGSDDIGNADLDPSWDLQVLTVPTDASESLVEAMSYVQMRAWFERGQNLERVVFLDDIVARGATRAIFEQGLGERLKTCVVCGSEQVVPMGMKTVHVVHDLPVQVSESFNMLQEQINGALMEKESRLHSYRVLKTAPDSVALRALESKLHDYKSKLGSSPGETKSYSSS